MVAVCLFVVCFLLGSIPWGLIISTVFFHKDIRKEGSGNIGTTNAMRTMGKAGGAAVFVLDFGKGLLAGALPLLAASGVGKIAIVDGDTVSESNLHRQTLYSPGQIGAMKARAAADALSTLNPDCEISYYARFFEDSDEFCALVESASVCIDAECGVWGRLLPRKIRGGRYVRIFGGREGAPDFPAGCAPRGGVGCGGRNRAHFKSIAFKIRRI